VEYSAPWPDHRGGSD